MATLRLAPRFLRGFPLPKETVVSSASSAALTSRETGGEIAREERSKVSSLRSLNLHSRLMETNSGLAMRSNRSIGRAMCKWRRRPAKTGGPQSPRKFFKLK